jgi:hypothetical protein
MGAKALGTPWDVVRRTVTEAGAEAQGETGAGAEVGAGAGAQAGAQAGAGAQAVAEAGAVYMRMPALSSSRILQSIASSCS